MSEKNEKLSEREYINERNRKAAEFKKLCLPVGNYLKKHYDPHTTVIITPETAELVRGDMGVQLDN